MDKALEWEIKWYDDSQKENVEDNIMIQGYPKKKSLDQMFL